MEYLDKLKKNDVPDKDSFHALLKKDDFGIDIDYLEFIKKHNGAEGFLSNDNYILLWNVQDLIALNPYYKDEPKCTNYFFFGSDGSNLGFAFDKKNKNIIAIDFIEIGITEPEFIATSFKLFINKLSEGMEL